MTVSLMQRVVPGLYNLKQNPTVSLLNQIFSPTESVIALISYTSSPTQFSHHPGQDRFH